VLFICVLVVCSRVLFACVLFMCVLFMGFSVCVCGLLNAISLQNWTKQKRLSRSTSITRRHVKDDKLYPVAVVVAFEVYGDKTRVVIGYGTQVEVRAGAVVGDMYYRMDENGNHIQTTNALGYLEDSLVNVSMDSDRNLVAFEVVEVAAVDFDEVASCSILVGQMCNLLPATNNVVTVMPASGKLALSRSWGAPDSVDGVRFVREKFDSRSYMKLQFRFTNPKDARIHEWVGLEHLSPPQTRKLYFQSRKPSEEGGWTNHSAAYTELTERFTKHSQYHELHGYQDE